MPLLPPVTRTIFALQTKFHVYAPLCYQECSGLYGPRRAAPAAAARYPRKDCRATQLLLRNARKHLSGLPIADQHVLVAHQPRGTKQSGVIGPRQAERPADPASIVARNTA